ncbi:hypothetical protein [Mesorhizobium sp. M2A.F.Ca.ET.067.02.1.1]|uniref:hypothetical protein n=1 Tax=Mesorhizobium sp. M2A.F.Ca.ET.067.02.1.1 TaxID=2496749 RepID=UPI000FD45D72|nr:hypothetical protein [Mesorhizobium sp. M2A.F.Ca.ET.067.02.1.1]RUW79625.1 hypothetical protein EOA28_07460 [Mesorhizobium sp. M2A.F.Ca.ET.067.02.1.1]
MMPGTVAQLPPSAAAIPPWVPVDADGMLDFVNGQYFLAGQTRAIATLLGGDFDPGAISGSGMYVNFDNSNRPTPIGVMLTRLLSGLAAGMTLVFEVSTASSLGGCLLYMGNDPDYNSSSLWCQAYIDGDIDDQNSLGITASISGAGTHRIALTFNRDVGGGNYQYAWCHDGNAAITQTVAYAASVMSASQLGWDGGAGDGRQLFQAHIRSITFYPALTPTALPALTA